ncbi:MAG: low molecular weight phosphatase family protein [Nitrososphaerales archaeon]
MKKILFVCVENAGRSQIAEAFARKYGGGVVEAYSAGTLPASSVHPEVIEVMKEKGFDLSGKKPQMLSQRMVDEADVVISMGCGAEGLCPAPLIKNIEDWEIEDPKGKSVEKVREIRDQIEKKVLELLDRLKS